MPEVSWTASGSQRRFAAPTADGITAVRLNGRPVGHTVVPSFGVELLSAPPLGSVVTIDYGTPGTFRASPDARFPGRAVVSFENGVADINLGFSSAGAGGSFSDDLENTQYSARPIRLVPGPAGASTAVTVDLSATQGAAMSQFLWDSDLTIGVLCYVPEHRGMPQLQMFLTSQANRMANRWRGTLQFDWGFSERPGWFLATAVGTRDGFADTTRVMQNGVLVDRTGGDNLLLNTTTPVDSIRFVASSVANNNIGTSPVSIAKVFIMPRGKPAALLQFDDCWASEWDAIEYMTRSGLRGTLGVTSTLIGAPNYLTVEQLRQLYAAGWDLVNHGATHFTAHAKTTNGICLSQTPVAGPLTLNGAIGGAVFDAPRHIVINPVGNESGRPFTVVGRGPAGEAQTEVLYGGFAVRTVSERLWTQITSITIPSNAAGALSVGTAFSYAEVRAEYETCRNFLRDNGWTRSLDLAIYPTGSINATVEAVMRDLGFRMGRITSGNIFYAYPHLPAFRPYEIPCWGGGGSAQVAIGYGVVGGFNTGNGTINTPTFAVGKGFVDWTVTMTAATTFEVRERRSRILIGTGSTGSAVTYDGVTFTVTAGGTPFVAGDSFRVIVASQLLLVEQQIIDRGAACAIYWHDIIRSGSVTSTQMIRAEYRVIVDQIAKDVQAGLLTCPTFTEWADAVST